MTLNTARAVALEITRRLATIRRSMEDGSPTGFETDIGRRIFRGRLKVSEDAVGVGCISIVEGQDIVDDQQMVSCKIDQRYDLLAYVPLGSDEEPSDGAHRALSDMKRVIWKDDATFNKQVSQVKYIERAIGPREDGVAIVLVILSIGVVFVENLSKP